MSVSEIDKVEREKLCHMIMSEARIKRNMIFYLNYNLYESASLIIFETRGSRLRCGGGKLLRVRRLLEFEREFTSTF